LEWAIDYATAIENDGTLKAFFTFAIKLAFMLFDLDLRDMVMLGLRPKKKTPIDS